MALLEKDGFLLGIFGPNCSSGVAITKVPERWKNSWENNLTLARMAEDAGIDFILPIARWIGHGGETDFEGDSLETFAWATGLVAQTKKIALVVTAHTAVHNPVVAAKMIATIDQIAPSRVALNIVAGWNKPEYEALGLVLPATHDERYGLAAEWCQIVRALWTKTSRFDWDGHFWKLKNVQGKPLPSQMPCVLNTAGSGEGRAFAVRNADVLFTVVLDPAKSKTDIAELKAQAAQTGRTVDVFTTTCVIYRPTEREARDFYTYYVDENADDEAADRVMNGIFANSKTFPPETRNAMRSSLIASHGSWPAIGTPRQVADVLLQLHEVGFRGTTICFVNYLDEFPYFRDEVLPLLQQAGIMKPVEQSQTIELGWTNQNALAATIDILSHPLEICRCRKDWSRLRTMEECPPKLLEQLRLAQSRLFGTANVARPRSQGGGGAEEAEKDEQRQLETNINPSTTLNVTIHATKEANKYPAKSHCRRVAAKLGAGKFLIVLQGEKAKDYSSSDQARPFRQDRYFYYLTGCNEANCFVTYDTEADKLVLWLPPIELARVYYDGRGSTIDEAMELYDIDDAVYITGKGTRNAVAALLEDGHDAGGKCLFIPPVKDFIDTGLRDKLKGEGRPGLQLRQALDACRAVKDEYEIALIRKANEISAEAHTNVLKYLHTLESEPEAEAVYVGTCLARGAKEQSYGPIVGSGPNASQLHYMSNTDQFADRQTLLIDAGAEWQLYASDVTRTMPINPKNPGHWQSEEAHAVYRHVEKIQEECIARLGPGKHFIDVAFHSIHMAIDALLDLGILKGDHMDIFKAGVVAAIYPHGLGHHLGLEVHDMSPPLEGKGGNMRFHGLQKAYNRFAKSSPAYAAEIARDDRSSFSIDPVSYKSPATPKDPPLAPGMIFTIEPGLYFNDFVLETFYLNDPTRAKYFDKNVLKQYMHVGGVRIEDDILITKDGYENLTTAPKGEEMLHIIREAAANEAR